MTVARRPHRKGDTSIPLPLSLLLSPDSIPDQWIPALGDIQQAVGSDI